MTKPTLKLTNTLTREKQTFTPIDPKNIGLYVCGVTPYDDSHIGHARVYVVFDVLYRLLRHLYGENHVTYVRNFTDIDDKIIQRAQELNQNPTTVAERNIMSFHEDMMALNVLLPNKEPRVSTSMKEIVEMVDELLTAKRAYITASGDVMFDVPAFERAGGHQPFGTLARRTFDKLQARVEGDEEKRDPRDFPVWKANSKSATKLEQAFSPKELGAKHFGALGRPGWHIECSAMSRQYLGNTFDIHGGGEDLQFPHHCCEIAQTESLLPAGQPMANIWLHNGFITVNGTKMSKSLGNFTTIKQALEKYSPEAIRLWFLQTHYRKPVDFSDEALQSAENRIEKILRNEVGGGWDIKLGEEKEDLQFREVKKLEQEFVEALLDDLNTPQALAVISKLVNLANQASDGGTDKTINAIQDAFGWMMNILGISEDYISYKERKRNLSDVESILIEARKIARSNKDWKKSDELRDELKAMGILVEDGPKGQTWRRL